MSALVDDAILRAELAKMEQEGALSSVIEDRGALLPPVSAQREMGYVAMERGEKERLHAVLRQYGLELINDGAVYRLKRQRDFTLWTLGVSPLIAEERGGGEAHALQEAVRRFCE